MMKGVINGKDAMIYFQGGDGYKLYGCATEVSISVDTEMKSVKTIGDGYWKKGAPQSLSYSITLNGLLKFDDNIDGWYLIDNQVNFIALAYRVVFISGAQVKRIEGQVWVQGTQLNAVPTDVLKASFNLTGTGALGIFNDDGNCTSTITNATLTIGFPSTISFAVSSGTAYVSFHLYRNDVEVYAGTVYAPTFSGSVGGILAPLSSYTVEGAPYCANDVSGAMFTKQF